MAVAAQPTGVFIDLDFPDDLVVTPDAMRVLEERLAKAPLDARRALTAFEATADEYQQKVIDAPERTIRLVAPAGSGKTQTLINRVLTRIQAGAHPDRFLILTFDNSAATSLKNTLARQGDGGALKLQISTLNAFGWRLLRSHVPVERDKKIAQDRDRYMFVRQIRKSLEAQNPDRAAAMPRNIRDRVYLDVFSLLKNALIDPRALDSKAALERLIAAPAMRPFFVNAPGDAKLVRTIVQTILGMYLAYEKSLQDRSLLDLDDQKLRAYAALMQDSALLENVQGQFGEVIVDEFQDINLLDFALVRAVSGKAVLLAVGDDDQAIYGFRGCTADFIIDLDAHLGRDIATYELAINYRCPPEIVAAADRLIRHNERRIPKSPVAKSDVSSEIKVVHSRGASLEAKSIVTQIKRLRRQTKLDLSNVAVLYRTNAQSLPLQIEMLLSDIPYTVRKEDSILGNETLQELLGVLRFKVAVKAGEQPSARDASFTVRAYFRYLRDFQEEQVEQKLASITNRAEFFKSPSFLAALPKAQNGFAAAMGEMLHADGLIATLDVLARKFKGLHGMIGSLEDVLDQEVPLGEIYEIATAFKGDTAKFIETMEHALERAEASGSGTDQADGVALRTYFRAKGLQWHTVFLTTCNESLIPHALAPVEDERRLFYVAMTRASSNLVISYVNKVVGSKVAPSRFLSEAGLM